MYWKSQSWPFHVRIKVVQCIMEPMILYFLPLLPWTKKKPYMMCCNLFDVHYGKIKIEEVLHGFLGPCGYSKTVNGALILNLDVHLMVSQSRLEPLTSDKHIL